MSLLAEPCKCARCFKPMLFDRYVLVSEEKTKIGTIRVYDCLCRKCEKQLAQKRVAV